MKILNLVFLFITVCISANAQLFKITDANLVINKSNGYPYSTTGILEIEYEIKNTTNDTLNILYSFSEYVMTERPCVINTRQEDANNCNENFSPSINIANNDWLNGDIIKVSPKSTKKCTLREYVENGKACENIKTYIQINYHLKIKDLIKMQTENKKLQEVYDQMKQNTDTLSKIIGSYFFISNIKESLSQLNKIINYNNNCMDDLIEFRKYNFYMKPIISNEFQIKKTIVK